MWLETAIITYSQYQGLMPESLTLHVSNLSSSCEDGVTAMPFTRISKKFDLNLTRSLRNIVASKLH